MEITFHNSYFDRYFINLGNRSPSTQKSLGPGRNRTLGPSSHGQAETGYGVPILCSIGNIKSVYSCQLEF